MDYTEDEELNIFTDELPDLRNDNRKKHNEVVSKAMEDFLDGLFDNEELQKEVYPEREFSQKPAEREDNPEKEIKFRLFRYKNQADLFIERFRGFENLSFEIVDDMSSFVSGAKILISCITAADGLICPNDELYQPGMLLIPVHTRGFQNCDLFFDKIYGDDTGHICGFKYFSKFRKFDELSNVLLNNNKGRENNKERILCYNIGLGLHDAVFSSHIYDILCDNPQIGNFDQSKAETKFWI